jgi:hypothetical protein
MRADEIYGFLVLRDPEQQTRERDNRWAGVDARHVDVYSDGADPSEFRQALVPLLKQGELGTARELATNLLAELTDEDRVELKAQLGAGASLARALRSCAASDDEDRATRIVGDLSALGIDGGDVRFQLRMWRDGVGDALVASLLSDDPLVNRANACASICATESVLRLVEKAAREPDVLPWQPPVFHGVVVLPDDLELQSAPAVGGGGLEAAERRSVGLRARARIVGEQQLTAAELLSAGAIRSYIGDLIVIDQELRRYELGEIAHVENVLLSEEYRRVHRDLKRVELQVSTVTETETINERDLQTTDRDEMRSELAKAVREDIRFGADVSATVSGKTPYGQYAVGANASFSYARSSEQREEAAHSHAHEVVDKAREQITERTRSARSTTTTTEDEDTTTHGFNNVDGDDDVVGVYRWLEKHYDLHLINYGRRLFYEIVLPDPAGYWKALSARRALVAAGPLPDWPSLPGQGGGDPEPLSPEHLSLLDAAGTPIDFPERWDEIVELASSWGVTLDRPPGATTELNFEIAVPPITEDTTDKTIHGFGDNTNGLAFYESGTPRTTVPDKAPKVPDGYEAYAGEVSFTGWMVVAKSYGVSRPVSFSNWSQFERGYAWLQIGGRQQSFSIGVAAGDGPTTRAMDAFFPDPAHTLTGEIPIALTTTLNGALCSCRLECRRLPSAVTVWISKTLDGFATAFAQRVADHSTAAQQSELDQRQRDYVRSDATYRAIERRELKRQIVDLLLSGTLGALGELVEGAMPKNLDGSVEPPRIDTARLSDYTRVVSFFEQAFDWTNLVYIFEDYFFGRGDNWESGALSEESDPQFTAFLGAGAVRVQVPARLGFESYVDAFFAGIGLLDPAQSVPWLPSGRPLALDIAAAARNGFELWPGRISIPADSTTATVSGTTFSATDDTNRELRIDGRVFRIVEVSSPTEIDLDRPAGAAAIDRVEYERGGIVVGPTIPLTLPSTLVAIDKPDLELPSFAGRYA